jgi:hypothetical protein
MIFYSPVPPSASSALKGNFFSSKAISTSEIVKAVGSIAASGGVLSLFRSQARKASWSSLTAARTNAAKNRSRCAALSCAQPDNTASVNSTHPASLKAKFGKRKWKNKNPKNAQ